MKLLIGLGNPGIKYEKTRHNIGFMVLDQFLKDFESTKNTVWTNSTKFKSDIAEITWQRKNDKVSKDAKQSQQKTDGLLAQKESKTSKILAHGIEKIILVKPKTFMNDSGLAVSLLTTYYKLLPTDLWVIHDDVDFPIGSMRIRLGGASAGHRGVMSIIDKLGTDKFYRFRMGIGRPGESEHSWVSHYVLDTFTHEDHSKIREMLKRASKAIQMGLEENLERAMNKYNSK